MFKRLLLVPLAALSCFAASAQFRYTFKDTTTPYVPLSGATSLSAGTIWDEEDLTTALPFTWIMDSTIAVNTLNLRLDLTGVFSNTSDYTDLNGFFLGDVDIADRGTLAGTSSLSPIRYLTTGTTPNRIFKLELANAGFYAELDQYGTMNDSFNLQLWIYEGSNIVEIHYGPSRITHPGDYFSFGTGGPLVGYMKHLDIENSASGSIYHLTGNAATPSIDTFSFPPSSSLPAGLNNWPVNGKVYRFSPRRRCTAPPTATYTAGTPTGKTVRYTFTGSTSATDSLVWDFGDGQKLKVTTAFTTPVSHTFATDGRYNVCVTAYNTCGSNVACKQLALAVNDLSALGDVRVYPNPAENAITIDGMTMKGSYMLMSATGQRVLNGTVSGQRQALDISGLPSGIYMLYLSNEQGAQGAVKITKR